VNYKQQLNYISPQPENTMKKIKVKNLALTQHLIQNQKRDSVSLKIPRKPVTGVKFYSKDISSNQMMQFVNKRKSEMKRNSINNNTSSIGSHTNRNSLRTSDNSEHRNNFMN